MNLKQSSWLAFLIVTTFFPSPANGSDDEVTLFNGRGKAVAYVAFSDELTIYLWNGKPVAYLEPDQGASGFHIYGFNGKHLGWFVDGVARDHNGDAACAVKERVGSPEYEPYKAYKEYKPYKSYKVYAPYRPAFSRVFGNTTCSAFVAEGGK